MTLPTMPTNVISTENTQSGNAEWPLRQAAPPTVLAGYALLESVKLGDAVPIAVSSNTTASLSWKVFRLGHYGGAGSGKF